MQQPRFSLVPGRLKFAQPAHVGQLAHQQPDHRGEAGRQHPAMADANRLTQNLGKSSFLLYDALHPHQKAERGATTLSGMSLRPKWNRSASAGDEQASTDLIRPNTAQRHRVAGGEGNQRVAAQGDRCR